MSPYSSDDDLDQQLREVALPEGLLARLQKASTWTDAEIDEALAEVPLPQGMISRLARVASRQKQAQYVDLLALAASLLLAVGLTYAGAWAIYAASNRATADGQSDWLATLLPVDDQQMLAAAEAGSPTDPNLAEQRIEEPAPAPVPTPPIELMAVEPAPLIPVFPSPFPWLDRSRHDRGLVELSLEHFGADVLGSSQMEAELPEWRLLPGLVPRGMEPPKSPAFDLGFLHATRFHPVVMPALDKLLATSKVPLGTSRESFLLARRSLADGELPPAEMIRTEEFLNAVDYAFPAPPRDRLALHVAAGPSPLGGPQLRLLQVAARGADQAAVPHTPAHLIFCVDVSSSMQRGARLEQAQQALKQIVPRLAPADRISLIAFDEKARVLIDQAGAERAKDLYTAIRALETRSGSDPVAGLRLAYGLAAEASIVPGRRQHVLLLTDGLVEVDSLTTRPLETYLQGSAGKLARLWLVDLGSSQVTPAHWLDLARAAGGQLHPATTIDEMHGIMSEALTGKLPQVAADVSLTVWFNPQSVAGYRLFGHEATLLPAEPQSELLAGQTSVGLYELQLLPKGADHVATATLTWRDLAGAKQTLTQRITRGSFAKNFLSAPAGLQLATLAAEAAELLRRSPYREAVNFRLLRELATEVSGSTVENPSYTELVSLVRQAERARPASLRMRQSWGRGNAR